MTQFASIGMDLFKAVLQGTPPGTVYALVALGFVLTYKTSGVFNLAFGAQAYVSAVIYFKLNVEWGWPILPSFFFAVVVAAPLVGLGLERLIFRRLRTASAVSKLVVTLGLTVALPSLVNLVMSFKAVSGKTPTSIAPDGHTVTYAVGDVYSFYRWEVVAIIVAVLAMLGLGAIFRFTGIGLQMRAVVESPRMTELNGVAADRVSAFAWALSSLFAGLAGVLIAPKFNTLGPTDFFNLVVVAVAAAAIGRLVSLPKAVAGGLGLGILIATINTFLPGWATTLPWLTPLKDNLTPAIPFLVLFSILVFVPGIRRSRETGDPLSGVDPPREAEAPKERSARSVLITRLVAAVAVAALVLVVFTKADRSWLNLITQAVVLGVIYLSITVVTGFAGKISLCQGTFAAIGAFTVLQLVDRYQLSVLVAAVIGAVLAAVVGAVLSLPIRRLSGIWVAIATLAFAFFFDSVMVKFSWVGGTSASARVPRPKIGPWDLADDRSFLVLAIIVFALVAVAVTQISGGTIGRTFQALRGSETAAQSIGISPAKACLSAFAISGFIAGLGGAMLAIQQKNVNYATNFSPLAALFWTVLVVTLGARSVKGAAVAAASFALFDKLILGGALIGWFVGGIKSVPSFLIVSNDWKYILFGLSVIQFARHPDGLLEGAGHISLDRFRRRRPEAEEPPATAPADVSPPPETPQPTDVEEAVR